MCEEQKNPYVNIIEKTGRTDLIDKAHIYEKKRDECLALIDEKSGVEKVDESLKDDQKRLEEKVRSNHKLWLKRLEKIDHRRKAEWAADDVQELEEEQKAELEQPGTNPHLTLIDNKEIGQLREYLREQRQTYSEEILTDIKAIASDLNRWLMKYRRTKALVFLTPKFIYLLFTLIVLTIGASKLGERITGEFFKLGFAVALWAGQEFLLGPFYGKWLSKYRRERLKQFTKQLTDFEIHNLFLEARIESGFEEHLSKET